MTTHRAGDPSARSARRKGWGNVPAAAPAKHRRAPSSPLRDSKPHKAFFLLGFLKQALNSRDPAAGPPGGLFALYLRGIQPGEAERGKRCSSCPLQEPAGLQGPPLPGHLPTPGNSLPALRNTAIKRPHQLHSSLANRGGGESGPNYPQREAPASIHSAITPSPNQGLGFP